MLGRKKKKVSEKTTEIIPKKEGIGSFNKFFIASAAILGSVVAGVAAKNMIDAPINTIIGKYVGVDNPEKSKNEKGSDLDKFKGMAQEKLDGAMLKAAKSGDADEIELLIRAGANMDARTAFGWTPLMMASQDITSDDAALLLISSNANLDAKNNVGMTALMIAAMNGRTTIVKALLEAGADSELKDDRGRTAYDIAVQYEWKQTAELLKNH